MGVFIVYLLLTLISCAISLNLDYLDPVKLQTKTTPSEQARTAEQIIKRYLSSVNVEVNPVLFADHKDVFALRTVNGQLRIRASTGVAALWAFNYYLKNYCKSQIAWQTSQVSIPSPLPEVDEVVVANDRFRYYQNVCTASYSFVWWKLEDWSTHVEWMAFNGINLALAPVAHEAAWAKIYKQLGMAQEEIDDYFTGPAFLSWLRMGNIHGWGGPLPQSWHNAQKDIQIQIVSYMFSLGMVPVLPAFNGHVPRAFAKIFPNTTFYNVQQWNKFNDEYCCNLFIDPKEPQFKEIGKIFLKQVSDGLGTAHIYTADPFNEIKIEPWSTSLVQETAISIYATLKEVDTDAVWLLQNWMFVHNPLLWPLTRVESFITAVPNGRMLLLDVQAEQWPQYNLYKMYYGQPFIWCMLHNFGGTLGMFGNMETINKDVYQARNLANSTMIGIGLTPEGINQNYVVYDLMLESAWRKQPIEDLDVWVSDYAERRYGCNCTAHAWMHLLKSVYNFKGLNRMRGKYVVTRRPSFNIRPWAWYKSHDLFEAFKLFALVPNNECNSDGFNHDLVDITRQALQYRAEQLYISLQKDRFSNKMVFEFSINRFLNVLNDMENILATNADFSIKRWRNNAKNLAITNEDIALYELNARNQITLWGPKGEITDYACKQWAELFHYYYIPRWRVFLQMALEAKKRNETFDERGAQRIVRSSVEEAFMTVDIQDLPNNNSRTLATYLYEKWAFVSDLDDLPEAVIIPDKNRKTTLADIPLDSDEANDVEPSVTMVHFTTPIN